MLVKYQTKFASNDSPQRHRDFTELHRGDRARPDASAYRSLLSPQQQDEVVRVNTDLVVLNVTVLDKDGKFVPGLKRSDFHILEDGGEQKFAGFTAEETPFAAAILLDTSGSMETRLTLGRSAAIRFLDG